MPPFSIAEVDKRFQRFVQLQITHIYICIEDVHDIALDI